jgi:hypothetical protein
MKKVVLVLIVLCLGLASYAQNDTTVAKQFAKRLNQLRKERGLKELTISNSNVFPKLQLYRALDTIVRKRFFEMGDRKSVHDSVRQVCQRAWVFDYDITYFSLNISNINDNAIFLQHSE